jgi:peptide chain release factor 1
MRSASWRVEVPRERRRDAALSRDHQPRRPCRRFFALGAESGTHRVQRVPATEAEDASTRPRAPWRSCRSSRRSAIELNPAELRVDTFRSRAPAGARQDGSGDSHHALPTGIVVKCQTSDRSDKNRSRAMSLLRLAAEAEQAQTQQRGAQLQVGHRDRSSAHPVSLTIRVPRHRSP